MPQSPTDDDRPQVVTDDSDGHFRTDHLKEDLGGRSTRGGAVAMGAQACKFVISTGSTIVLARLLAPQDYGLVGMVAILVNFVTMFQYMGLSTATIHWPELNHKQVSALFWINLALSFAIMLVAMASAPVLAWFYQEPRLIGITLGYAVSILLTGLAIQHEALLGRQMRFAALAIIDLSSLVLGIAAAITAARYGAGYWALVINQLVMTTVQVAGSWIACRWRPGLPSRGTGIRSMLAYGGNLTGFNLMTFLARNLDNALIGRFWGAQQLGLYAKAYQLLLMPIEQIGAPIANVAMPTLSRLADSPERYRRAYLRIIEKLAMVTMPLVAFMIATSDWLVLFLLGPQWSETGRIFMFLGIAAIVQPVTKTLWWLLSTQGRTREIFHWGLIGGAIAVASIIAGMPWGAMGVAAAYAVSDLCLSTPLLFWFVGRRGPIRAGDFYKVLAAPACASVCALGVLVVSRPWLGMLNPIARLALAFTITLGVSLLVFAVLPAGRLAMKNFKEMLILLVKGRKSERAA